MRITIFFAAMLVFFSLNVNSGYAEESERDFIHRISFGSAEDVKYYLDKGRSASLKDASGENLLTIVAGRSDDQAPLIVRLLLEAGADVNAKSASGEYPVTAATKYGRADSLQVLLARLPALSVQDRRGKNLREIAVERGDPQISAVVEKGLADEEARLEAHRDPDNISKLLQEYSFLKCSVQYLGYYADSGIDPNLDLVNYQNVIRQINTESEAVFFEIKKYSKLPNSEIKEIAEESMEKIFEDLERMGSNAFRIRSGFGKDKDLNKRCGEIASAWSVKNK